MSVRRSTDPYMTQRIWDSIKINVHQRNLPTNDRVARHLSRIHCITEPEAQSELDKAVADGLILRKKTSSKVGGTLDQEIYCLQTELLNKDNHDWYCYMCHKAGLVECCKKCHRVFHTHCYTPVDQDDKLCHFCQKISEEKTFQDKKTMNTILSFACGHMKAKLPQEITNRTIIFNNSQTTETVSEFSGPTWKSEGEDSWRPGMLIKNHMDLAIMDLKVSRNEYNNLTEFEADAHNILHNIIIYHGEHNMIGDMGQTMYRDCQYDLQEIRRCPDCYRISNEKPEKMWFCIPCNPPHQLVFAKQKGYPYWPAKVMKIEGDIYDVRYFGGHHLRANIEKMFIRPITSKISSLQISKRSAAWNKAYDELKYHQNWLKKINKEKIAYEPIDAEEWRSPKKMKKVDTNSMLKKSANIYKEVKVKVERLCMQNNSQQAAIKAADKGQSSLETKVQRKERQVPELSIAEDEPPTEISSTYPQGLKKDSQEDMVTSSCQEPRLKSTSTQTDLILTDVLSSKKLRREMELDKCKEIERLQEEYANQLRELTEKHKQIIAETKKKQWCQNCGNEAIYHCCWNTAYCSTECQQMDWQRIHKRTCRRKR